MSVSLTRDMPDRSRIVATLELDRGYFSLSGELYEPHGTWSGGAQHRNGREADAGGQITSELERAFPQLEPFARMHLSDVETGEPMHALANARYFWRGEHLEYELSSYGQSYVDRHGSGAERAARTLRVEVSELPDPATTTDEEFEAFVDSLRPRWADEARAARELYAQLSES